MLSYDSARYIGEAIRSVLAHTYQRWKLVVVDDASHDESLAVIGSFDVPRIRCKANDRRDRWLGRAIDGYGDILERLLAPRAG